MATYTYTLSAEDWVEHEVTCDEADIEDHARDYAEGGINWDGDWEWKETIYQDVSWRWVNSDGEEQVESTIFGFDPPAPPCRGETEHDWIDKKVNGREECPHCLMSRWVDIPRWIVIFGLSLDNSTTRIPCLTYATHDDDRAPESFVTRLDQVEVRTDGSDYLPGDWSEMTEEERDEHDEWIARLHDAHVELAELDPDDREWVTEHAVDTGDPDSLEGALDLYRMREVCRSAYSGMTEAQQRDVDALISDDDAWDDPQRFRDVIDEVYARWSEPAAAN